DPRAGCGGQSLLSRGMHIHVEAHLVSWLLQRKAGGCHFQEESSTTKGKNTDEMSLITEHVKIKTQFQKDHTTRIRWAVKVVRVLRTWNPVKEVKWSKR